MPQINRKIIFLLFCSISILLTACTDARRYFEGRTDSRAKSSSIKETSRESSSLPDLFASASPSPSASTTTSAKPASNLAAFKGDIAGKAGKEKLYNFLEKHEQGAVKIDLLLSDEQLQQLTEADAKKWYFDLGYEDKDGYPTGGELWIDISKGKNGLHLDGNHLQGQIKIAGWSGPHQGLMSINAKPMGSENSNVKKEETRDAPAPRR